MPPLISVIHHGLCCCCCKPRRRRLRIRYGDEDWDEEELEDLEDAAWWWLCTDGRIALASERRILRTRRQCDKETGRTCGDFFKTLRAGPTADAALAGRATLLTRVKNINDFSALALSTTICARMPVQPRPRAAQPVGTITPAPGRYVIEFDAPEFVYSQYRISHPTLGAAIAEAREVVRRGYGVRVSDRVGGGFPFRQGF